MKNNKFQYKTYIIIFSILFAILINSSIVIGSTDKLNFEPEIFDAFENKTEVRVIVWLHDNSNSFISANKIHFSNKNHFEQRKEYVELMEYEVLDTIPASDFKVTNKYRTVSGFAGLITKEGFEKLIKNPNVEMVYLDRQVKIDLSESAPIMHAYKTHNEKILETNLMGEGQYVCIIDTGVNNQTADMIGIVVEEKFIGLIAITCMIRDVYEIDL